MHSVELRMPTMEEMFPLLIAPSLRIDARMSVLGPAEIKRVIGSIDGKAMDIELARAIHADRAAFTQYAQARNCWLETISEAGRVWAECPHCQVWNADLDPLAYGVGLRHEFAPVTDDGKYLALPSVSERTQRGGRPDDIPLTSRLSFELPCARNDISESPSRGAFWIGDTVEREEQARQQWATPDAARHEGREQWREDLAGFRAILRMSALLKSLDDSLALTPAMLMNMGLADFLFLDNLHHLAHDVTVPEDHGLTIRCARCGENFLPLL
jgi:hypothetical protein